MDRSDFCSRMGRSRSITNKGQAICQRRIGKLPDADDPNSIRVGAMAWHASGTQLLKSPGNPWVSLARFDQL